MQVAIAKRALGDAPHCGDECACWHGDGRTTLCVIDGLGHGEHAKAAAKAAAAYVASHLAEPLAAIFAGCDAAIRHTRGAAMGLALIDEQAATLTYAGVGNTRATVAGRPIRWLGSSSGIVGAGYRSLWPETVALAAGDLVVLYTDGLPHGIDLTAYPQTLRTDIERLARTVLRERSRRTDDAAVLVCRPELA